MSSNCGFIPEKNRFLADEPHNSSYEILLKKVLGF